MAIHLEVGSSRVPPIHFATCSVSLKNWRNAPPSFLSDPSPIIGYHCHWLCHRLTLSHLEYTWLMWPWCVKMPTQNLLTLFLLQMLMLRIMLAKAFWLGSWRLVIKLNFCSDFEHKGWSRFRSWSLGKILKLEFFQHFAAESEKVW